MGFCDMCQSAGSVNRYGYCEVCGNEHEVEDELSMLSTGTAGWGAVIALKQSRDESIQEAKKAYG